jgi:hypothetical protein
MRLPNSFWDQQNKSFKPNEKEYSNEDDNNIPKAILDSDINWRSIDHSYIPGMYQHRLHERTHRMMIIHQWVFVRLRYPRKLAIIRHLRNFDNWKNSVHVDHNFLILKNGRDVFQLSNETGQPQILLHSSDGQIGVPVLNNHDLPNGKYTIKIPIYGILFNPIKPEISEFKVNMKS